MAVTTGFERLLNGLHIPEARRLALWERAERMRIGVDHARATRAALADRRGQRC